MTTEILEAPTKSRGLLARVGQTIQSLETTEEKETDGLAAVGRLTFLMLIASSGLDDMLEYAMIGLCVIGFVLPAVYRQSGLWFLITGVMLWGQVPYWYEIDNHKYLMTYWCGAMFCSTLLPESLKARALAFTARWMIGLCFLFATVWKAITPNYLDNSFFTLQLLEDPRFYPATMYVCGLSETDLRAVREKLSDLERLEGTETAVVLMDEVPPGIRRMSLFLTWMTIGFEAWIALCFLPFGIKFLDKLRHLSLILFGTGVYALATVQGFGLLLMTMGVAQCELDRQKTRIAYIVVFSLIYLYGLGKMMLGI